MGASLRQASVRKTKSALFPHDEYGVAASSAETTIDGWCVSQRTSIVRLIEPGRPTGSLRFGSWSFEASGEHSRPLLWFPAAFAYSNEPGSILRLSTAENGLKLDAPCNMEFTFVNLRDFLFADRTQPPRPGMSARGFSVTSSFRSIVPRAESEKESTLRHERLHKRFLRTCRT
jgi:hypothetical protein